MRFTILYALVVALIGLLIYYFGHAPWVEIGRITYAAGMFAFCFQLGGKVISAGTP